MEKCVGEVCLCIYVDLIDKVIVQFFFQFANESKIIYGNIKKGTNKLVVHLTIFKERLVFFSWLGNFSKWHFQN